MCMTTYTIHVCTYVSLCLNQVNGRYEFDIDADDYRGKVRYRYDPFCVRSSIKIVAEVTESGRNAKQSDSIVVPLVSNPLTVSFDDDLPPIFRPGLPYIVRVCIYMYMYI